VWLKIDKLICALTVVCADKVLLAGVGSVSVAVTFAMFVIVPPEAGVTTTLTVANDAPPRVENVHVTSVAVAVPHAPLPEVTVAETNVEFVGNVSVSTRFVAALSVVIVTEYVTLPWPRVIGSGLSV